MALLGTALDAARTRPDLAVLLCLGILVVLFIRSHKRHVKGNPLPSPRGYPLIGNALQIGAMPWYQMTKWSKEFGTFFVLMSSQRRADDQLVGPVFQVNMAGQTAVVLNSYRVASDLLDKRSGIYSDRPRMIMTSEILCGNHFFPFLRYGST